MISEIEEKLIDIDNKVEIGDNNINTLSISKDEKIDMELGMGSRGVKINVDSDNEIDFNDEKINTARVEREAQERIEELEFRRDVMWKSCCGQVIDRRATQYFTQVIIGGIVMGFCMAKIYTAEEDEDTTVYFSLLSTLVGFYIPAPTMNNKQ